MMIGTSLIFKLRFKIWHFQIRIGIVLGLKFAARRVFAN